MLEPRRLVCAAMVAAFLVGLPTLTHAQNAPRLAELQGTVVEDDSGVPIPGAGVEYRDRTTRARATVVTDDDGQFIIPDARAGTFTLVVSRIGYRRTTTPAWSIRAGEALVVEIRMDPEAVPLAPLEIIARRTASWSPVASGFNDRRNSGLGTFIDREDIERRKPATLTDLLATLPGVRLVSGGGAGRSSTVEMARALPGRPGGCPVQVFVDGRLMTRQRLGTAGQMEADAGFSLDGLASPQDLLGIEVYRGVSSVPAEFLTQDARCGVIAIWTRRGDRP